MYLTNYISSHFSVLPFLHMVLQNPRNTFSSKNGITSSIISNVNLNFFFLAHSVLGEFVSGAIKNECLVFRKALHMFFHDPKQLGEKLKFN